MYVRTYVCMYVCVCVALKRAYFVFIKVASHNVFV